MNNPQICESKLFVLTILGVADNFRSNMILYFSVFQTVFFYMQLYSYEKARFSVHFMENALNAESHRSLLMKDILQNTPSCISLTLRINRACLTIKKDYISFDIFCLNLYDYIEYRFIFVKFHFYIFI